MYHPKRYLVDFSNFLRQRFLYEPKDILAMQQLEPISSDYLPWNPYAIRPSGLIKILNEIVINQRKSILECGGGISTIYMAKILRERGGRIHTIEHDLGWIEILKQLLSSQNLLDYVSIISAPLQTSPINFQENTSGLWYDLNAIRNALEGIKIDLLLVDGPPAHSKSIRYARYPAVPLLKQYLAEDYTIVLDDIGRTGEQQIAAKWQQELEISFQKYPIQGGVAIASSQKNYVT